VVCTQNHDQVGNRAQGERLSALVPRGALHVAAAMVLLSPNTPLLFMGEEYAERAPFLYFVDHSDPELIEAVRRGRREEFKAFGWTTVPDPADPKTFESSRLALGPPTDPLGSLKDEQRRLLRWYAALLHLRKSVPALGPSIEPATGLRAWAAHDTVFVHRWDREGPSALILANFSGADVRTTVTEPEGRWVRKMTSDDPLYGGSGRGQAPDRIDVTAGGPVTVALQPYEAVVYLTAEREAG
jgi:maltooligosyltrehalose trehalohydrolase